MKILGPNEIGKGILIEYDAGSVSWQNSINEDFGRKTRSPFMTVPDRNSSI